MAKKPNKSKSKRQPAKNRLSQSHAKKVTPKKKTPDLNVAEQAQPIEAAAPSKKDLSAKKRPSAGAKKSHKSKRLKLPLGFKRHLVITIEQRKPAAKPKRAAAKKLPDKKAQPRKRSPITATLLILIGLSGLGYFGWNTIWAPAPSNAFSPPLPAAQTTQAAPTAAPTVVALPRSEPAQLRVPAVGIDTPLMTVGKNPDGTMEVPSEAKADIAGWYKFGPTPGELGPSVIVGHVDSPKGPAVFWRLRELKPGDMIEVGRADGKTAKFKVDSVKEFEQDKFPTQEVYGNITHAGLRLITCGGTFNRLTRHYSHNTVVYATLAP